MPRTVETYEQAIEFLYSRINYERAQPDTPEEFKLDRMRRLLALVGNPHERLPVVHIAGTKGKGSTAVMTAEILEAAGYRVGLFTSPHLTCYEERMRVNGAMPSHDELVDLVRLLLDPIARLDAEPGAMGPTYFEVTTALAWLHFERQQVQLAVMEVGLGGRLDSTNLCRPEVTLITTISRDHTHLLGDTLAEIAGEKAGIVKPGIPAISGVLPDEPRAVIEATCGERSAPLIQLGRDLHCRYHPNQIPSGSNDGRLADLFGTIDVQTPWSQQSGLPVPLAGEHQGNNAALAVCAVDVLVQRGWNISADAVRQGLAGVTWPARIEVLAERPTVIIDAAHNWAAIEALVETLNRRARPRRRILVFAGTRDKDVAGMLRLLLPEFDSVILTQYTSNPRSMPIEQLSELGRSQGHVSLHAASEPAAAWQLARQLAQPDDLICITGSFFIAAELRERILAERTSETATPLAGTAMQPALV